MKRILGRSGGRGSIGSITLVSFSAVLFASALLVGACGPGYVDAGDIASQQYQNDDPGQSNGIEAGRVVLGVRDADLALGLAADQVAAIELPCNASTGYLWEVSDLDTGKLKVLGSEIVEENNGLLGAPGKQVFYVAGVDAGRAEIRFDHRRPFVVESPLESTRFTLELQGRFVGHFTPPAEPPAPAIEQGGSLRAALPTHYSWCENGGCTPVKDQGNCGSCWSFSTVGAFESAVQIADGVTRDFSEQYLVSCNSEGWGCNGGFFAHDYHISKKVSGETQAGGVLESTFPYQAYDSSCNPPHAKVAQLQSWSYITNSSSVPSVDQIKNAIYNYGPVSAAMCAGSTAFNNYSGGVYTYNCTSVDHAIILVGWDDNDGAWILRNSWGPNWGENGYMRIKYGVSKVGYGANYVVYQSQANPPSADFDFSVNGLTATFADSSSDADGSVVAWSWNFGDGATSSAHNPSHTYASSGTYTVTLTVTDDETLTDSISKSVTVSGGQVVDPVADFNFSAQGLAVSFTDASSGGSGTLTNWSWNFGDGASSSSHNPSHTYAADGTYSVSLTVTNSDGLNDSVTKSVTVQAEPQGDYCDSGSNNCSYEYIKQVQVDGFSNSSSAQTYTDFTGQVISLGAGQHSITLTPGFSGSSYTEYYKVWIDLDQNGDFTGNGEEVFSAHAKTAVSGTLTIPAGVAQGQTRMRVAMRYNSNPSSCGSFDYGEVEDYTVEFGSSGGSVPTADFSASVQGLTAAFTDQSTDQGSTITSWSWSFGDGASSSTKNPSHTYAAAGTYTVSLSVTDGNGISDQASAAVTVSAPDPGITVLENGVPVSGVAASQGEWRHFKIVVPEDASNLVMTISGSNGDADIYTRFGAQPTASTYDCRPYQSGSNETCSVASPNPGEYYISVNAYATFSSLTVQASYDEGGGSDDGLPNGEPVTGLAAAKGQWVQFHINVPAGAGDLVVSISGGSGDADLYVRYGAEPTTSQYDCRPYLNGNNETCSGASPQVGTYYIGIRAYQAFSGVTLTASYTP